MKFIETGSTQPHLLDVGCSSGSLLSIASSMGLTVSGVEPASVAAKAAQEAGFDVFSGYLHEAAYQKDGFEDRKSVV